MQGLIIDIEDATQSLPGRIGPETVLKSIEGWDSLAFVSFIAAVQDRYGVELSAEDLLSCRTVTDLHHLLSGKATLSGTVVI
ncbi:MAG: phosphopantetheine-binding protein [Aquabacterium sp.]